jgi:enoyl-[acyl-carrier protein] reductase I
VANVVAFLLSGRSSGVNGTTVVVDAGLGSNYFDQEIVRLAMRPAASPREIANPTMPNAKGAR